MTTPLPSENTGVRDAAVVVAIGQYPELPGIPGAHRNGEDWGRFFVELFGVPATRVTELYDSKATRAAILDAIKQAGAKAEPGGRLWFVFIGHGQTSLVPSDAGDGRDVRRLFSLADVEEVAARDVVELVSVFDVGFDKDVVARLGARPGRARPAGPLPIVLGASRGGPLPGDGRPAISYLLLGALRGWADSNGDGRVTAREAVGFVRHTLTSVAGWHKEPAQPYLGAFECQSEEVLSTLREPAPNLSEIIPPRGRSAEEAALKAAREAVARADERLQRAISLYEESGHRHGIPERREPRFVGEGDDRRIEIVAMPSEVSEAAAVRVAEAAKLGGPDVRDAAQLLIEAGAFHRAYGDLGAERDLLSPVLRTRCGWDEVGFAAWWKLMEVASFERNQAEAERLAKMDCAFDEASEESVRGTRQPLPLEYRYRDASLLYQQAEKETDPEIARCRWSAVAREYDALLRAAPTRVEQPEAAMNGAYAYRAVGQPDAAAAMYRIYLRAQAAGIVGDSAHDAAIRHRYSIVACQQYGSLVKEVPRLRPEFVDVCVDQSWLDCSVERDACNGITNAVPPEMPGVLARTPAERAAEALSQRARGREELVGWEWRDADRVARLGEAVDLYRAAEGAWASIAGQSRDTGRQKGFELLRLAEARTRIVTLGRATGIAPAPEQVVAAENAARAARDASFDDIRREAAELLVDIADSAVERSGQLSSATKVELPRPVREAIHARDEYLTEIQATRDSGETRSRFAYEAAQWLVQYGQLGEARARLEPLYARECGRTRLGFDTWASLLGVAVLEGDVTASRRLAAARPSCAIDAETRLLEAELTKPMLGLKYLDSFNILEASSKLPEGPAKQKERRDAAAALRVAVDEAPRRMEAPDATLTAARVYQELGEPSLALEMYVRFIEQYATDTALERLDKGSPKAQPSAIRDPEQYARRVRGLEEAYRAVASLQTAARDYRAAALTYSRASARVRLPQRVRLEAAGRAVALCAARGVPGTLLALREIFAELRAPAAEQRKLEAAAKRATAALQSKAYP